MKSKLELWRRAVNDEGTLHGWFYDISILLLEWNIFFIKRSWSLVQLLYFWSTFTAGYGLRCFDRISILHLLWNIFFKKERLLIRNAAKCVLWIIFYQMSSAEGKLVNITPHQLLLIKLVTFHHSSPICMKMNRKIGLTIWSKNESWNLRLVFRHMPYMQSTRFGVWFLFFCSW